MNTYARIAHREDAYQLWLAMLTWYIEKGQGAPDRVMLHRITAEQGCMESYIIRAALNEEANEGWVWLAKPSRTVVCIKNPEAGRSVYSQVRDLRDDNFIRRDNRNGRIDIVSREATIVMGQWYRDALAIASTTEPDNATGRVDLVVMELSPWGWGALRAACHHPDLYARLATRLGVLGAWLGVFGLMDPIAKLSFSNSKDKSQDWLVFAVAIVTAILGLWACRGLRRPRDRSHYA